MRVLSGIGAAVFAYLALIPFSLIASNLDNACSGPGCETSMPVNTLLLIVYAGILVALAGTAVVFADHAIRGRPETLAREPVALKVCGAAIGIALFVLFCLMTPVGGAIASVIGIAAWRGMHRYNERIERGPPDSGLTNEQFRLGAGPPPGDPRLN